MPPRTLRRSTLCSKFQTSLTSSANDACSFFNSCVRVSHALRPRARPRLESELRERAAAILRELDGGAGHVVRVAERHALAHEVLREVGRQHLGPQLARHGGGHGLQRGQHASGDRQAALHGARHVEQALLVLLTAARAR